MNKLKVGILGCANIAIKSAIPAMNMSKNIEIVAVASREVSKAIKVSETYNIKPVEGYENLLKSSDIDAVYIPLPPALHKEWCLKAFSYGKHVLVEKPSTTSLDDTKVLTEKAEEKSLVFIENYMFEYHHQVEYIKKLIKDNTIGEVKQIRSSFGFPMMNQDNFRYSKRLGGGVLLDAGGYPVKAATIFLGEELEVLSSNLIYSDKLGVDVFGTATLVNNNRTAQISFGFDNYYQCNLEIWGSKGKISTDRIFTAPPGYNPKIIVEKQNEKHEYIINNDNHFLRILEDFHYKIEKKQISDSLIKMNNQSRLIEDILNRSKGMQE